MFGDSDLDSCYDVQPNATCSDCGVDFSRGEDDPTTTCDTCSDRRDVHTSRLQRRLVMAKAAIGAPAPEPRLAPAEIALCVALLGNGYTKARAFARIQSLRSRLPFSGSEVA